MLHSLTHIELTTSSSHLTHSRNIEQVKDRYIKVKMPKKRTISNGKNRKQELNKTDPRAYTSDHIQEYIMPETGMNHSLAG